ncbi:MAG: undecaprenyldiphospho-muramoylpentapeptide beta-N-acetylglucosaminyltransferase [Polyangiaceae bacterium]|nr:undecaprenyldiphospho-muramoylpentapeptide beta-N-acetylglucosaminyltransferase [Polyangiaceae bacterium]
MTRPTVLLAGGGTGGHVFPLIAVADALSALAPEVNLVFVGTERGMEVKLVPERGYALELVKVSPIRGGGLGGAVRGVWRAMMSIPESRALLERHAPRAVLSIGGYAAGPISLAARLKKTPLALIEPNSVMGLANRLTVPLVQRAYVAFPQAGRHFGRGTALTTGVPIRGGFEPRPFRRPGDGLEVLVLGGSQGAKSLNETVPAALGRVGAKLRVTHQCGAAHADGVRATYEKLGARFDWEVVPFIQDVPAALGAANLVISRAGASAVSEIAAVGRPALFVPYPYAAGDHQRHNAETLARAGAAVSIAAQGATVETIAAEVERLATEPGLLEQMAAAAEQWGKPHAAAEIARDLLRLAGLALEAAGTTEPQRKQEAPDDGAPRLAEVAG